MYSIRRLSCVAESAESYFGALRRNGARTCSRRSAVGSAIQLRRRVEVSRRFESNRWAETYTCKRPTHIRVYIYIYI